MRKYDVIFFDWDGTAVTSRAAPVYTVAKAMAPLLSGGVKLVVISGTSLDRIAGGKLACRFSPMHRRNLFFGLGRGARNFGFDAEGNLIDLPGIIVSREDTLALHRVCFGFHEKLLNDYGVNTDILFNRESYCKIDVGADICVEGRAFLTAGDLKKVNDCFASHGYYGGLRGLLAMAEFLGRVHGLALKATTDGKHIEVGYGTKSDNVDAILSHLEPAAGGCLSCCFWGDEFMEMDAGVYGSDSYMITEKSRGYDFFDVSDVAGRRPEPVVRLGGDVERFLSFLHEQALLL